MLNNLLSKWSARWKGVCKDVQNESGAVSIKGIAATVAVIVVIGFAVAAIETLMPGWINEIWTMFIDQISGNIGNP